VLGLVRLWKRGQSAVHRTSAGIPAMAPWVVYDPIRGVLASLGFYRGRVVDPCRKPASREIQDFSSPSTLGGAHRGKRKKLSSFAKQFMSNAKPALVIFLKNHGSGVAPSTRRRLRIAAPQRPGPPGPAAALDGSVRDPALANPGTSSPYLRHEKRRDYAHVGRPRPTKTLAARG